MDEEPTRPIPPYHPEPAPSGLPTAAPAPARRARTSLTAGVLAGALVLGGVAGVGGAAAYDALNGTDGSSQTADTASGGFEATKASVVKDGTVEKVADALLPSVVKVNVSGQQEAGSGSGIVLSKDGEILTNNHVVAVATGGGSISVTFNNGTTKKATVIGTDPLTDIAVIKAQDVSDLTPAALGKSSALRVGQEVVAVGAPFGLSSTVTAGIVSALNRPVSVSTDEGQSQDPFGGGQQGQGQGQSLSTTYPAIQTDAAINPGNSGGPLVDLSGRVVGINSSIRTAGSGGFGADSSGGSIGLGFAIPIDEVLPIVNQITDKQAPTHARLGVQVSNATGGNGLTQGGELQSVESGGAADGAGLQKGDVITKVDDQVIDGSESLVATIRGHRPGDKVTITYLRDGKTRTTTAELGSDKGTQNS